MDFGKILEALKEGRCCYRKGWNGKGLFVYKQIPCSVKGDSIVNLQSMPSSAKRIISLNFESIHFTSIFIIYNKLTGRADSWVPSSSDLAAEDWEIIY